MLHHPGVTLSDKMIT